MSWKVDKAELFGGVVSQRGGLQGDGVMLLFSQVVAK